MTPTDPVETPGSTPAEPAAPQQLQGFFAELFDAITARTVLLVIGVLLIQLGFVLSYVGASTVPPRSRFPWRSLHRRRSPAMSSPSSATYRAGRSRLPPFPAEPRD
jgi:hypothetical protein